MASKCRPLPSAPPLFCMGSSGTVWESTEVFSEHSITLGADQSCRVLRGQCGLINRFGNTPESMIIPHCYSRSWFPQNSEAKHGTRTGGGCYLKGFSDGLLSPACTVSQLWHSLFRAVWKADLCLLAPVLSYECRTLNLLGTDMVLFSDAGLLSNGSRTIGWFQLPCPVSVYSA